MPTSAVLIIANPFEARMVARAVEAAGLRPVVAEGGAGAIDKLEREQPSAVVLAQGLHHGSELELLDAIRDRPDAPAIVLILDGKNPDPRLSADDVLGRPINPTLLAERLADVARRVAAAAPAPGDETWWEAPPEGAAAAGEGEPAQQHSGVDDDAWWVEEMDATPATLQMHAITAAEIAAAGGDGAAEPALPDPSRPSLMRMDDALSDGLFGEQAADATPAARRSLEQQLSTIEKRLSSRGPRSHPALDSLAASRLSLDTLPGLDAELGLGVAQPAFSGNGGSEDAARESHAPIDGALQRLIPGRDAQLGARAIDSARATPELDEGSGLGDLPDSGDLGRESLPELIAKLHRAGYSGRLALRRGEGEKAIYFDGGFPVHAISSLPHDRLGELLWREGKISKEQNVKSRTLSERGGRRVVDALVEIQALKRDELFKVLRHHAEEIIYSCFGWDRGAWSLGRETARRDEKVSLAHPYAIAIEGIRRKYGLERLVQLVGARTDSIVATPSLWRLSADAGLSQSERDAVQSLRRGPRTINELQQVGRLDEIGAYALAHGLLVLGAAVRVDAEAFAAAGEPVAEETVVDRERALAKYAQVLDGDYFAILGVARTASAYEIKRAFERMRADFAPERFDAKVQSELRDKLSEIAEVVDEAWRALGNERLRDAYRAHLID